jgi:hypothetical protein
MLRLEKTTRRGREAERTSSPGRPFMPAPREFEEHGIFTVPEDVPELGVKAGDPGVIAGVYEGGRLLDLEITHDDGTSVGFVDVRLDGHGVPIEASVTPFCKTTAAAYSSDFR